MKKVVIGWMAGLLAVCAAGLCLLQWGAEYGGLKSCDTVVQPPPSLTASLSGTQLEKERNLARWYNVTLRDQIAGEALSEAYNTLMDFGAGKMGYLELPEQGLFLPIVHESEVGENHAVHCFGTALPIGGRGNCTVLRCEGLTLFDGEIFRLHILDTVLVYTVKETGNWMPNHTQEDLCVLVLSLDGESVYVTGVRQ